MDDILAIQLSEPDPNAVLPWNGVQFEDGWRAVMTVEMILAKVQTTVFFGHSMYMVWNSVGSMNPQEGFSFFLKEFYNKERVFAQLSEPPYAAISARYRRLLPAPPPAPPVALGKLTLLGSGFDPLRGYWIEVAGNFFLSVPIFKNHPNVKRDGPGFNGFQATK